MNRTRSCWPGPFATLARHVIVATVTTRNNIVYFNTILDYYARTEKQD